MFNWLKKNNQKEEDKKSLDDILTEPETQPDEQIVDQNPEFEIEEIDTTSIFTPEYHVSDNSRMFNKGNLEEYLLKQKTKLNTLTLRYANGELNKSQFENMFQHYQNKIHKLEAILEEINGGTIDKRLLPDGQTILIRRKFAARLCGMAVYQRSTLKQLVVEGKFDLENKFVVPMLHAELAELETSRKLASKVKDLDNLWLIFIFGEESISAVLLTAEPSGQQTQKLIDLHAMMENANRTILKKENISSEVLVIPHKFLIGRVL